MISKDTFLLINFTVQSLKSLKTFLNIKCHLGGGSESVKKFLKVGHILGWIGAKNTTYLIVV